MWFWLHTTLWAYGGDGSLVSGQPDASQTGNILLMGGRVARLNGSFFDGLEPPWQPRLRKPMLTPEERAAADLAEKLEAMESFLSNLAPFSSLGDFLSILFFNRQRSSRGGTTHAKAVSRFLSGRSEIRMSHILPLIYKHRSSVLSISSARSNERDQMFCTSGRLEDIQHARPFMSTWAARLTAEEARQQILTATSDDPDDPDTHIQLRATSNGRGPGHVIMPQDVAHFSFMSAPRVKGVFVVRKRRPHPMIQVSAIASFIISRNRYANGDLAMILGLWHIACKSHVDVKRVYCRLGGSVADSTAREALNSITAANFTAMQERIRGAAAEGEVISYLIVDNVQEYCPVYEQGIGRQSQLKVGTAATRGYLQDCKPGAFAAKPYYDRVAQNLRRELTLDTLFADIDWTHVDGVIQLHWISALVEFAPELNFLLPEISLLFRTEYAKHRMREGREPTPLQPLSTNSEHELTAQGMERGIDDFDVQSAVETKIDLGLLKWLRGDGASYAMILRLAKYCAPLGDKFKNKVSTPEIWHTGATDLNSTAANHYGPATFSNPSSLSKCSNAAGFKRPSNLKSCDYYPTVRNCTTIWRAHILDCWRLFLGADDLEEHVQNLAKTNQLPTLKTLLQYAEILVDRYTSQAAAAHAMTAEESPSTDHVNPVPIGSPWAGARSSAAPSIPAQATPPPIDEEDMPAPDTADQVPNYHQELPGFTGDRVLCNSELFMMDFGWFIELITAVPEGDIGRVWEIMKIWIFKFAGSSHQQYMSYLLEVYCFLKYEAGDDLKDAILNNWLVNLEGELGKWIPGDLLQEHYNRWLEDMMKKHGSEFDNKFYRRTISPNVHYFLQIKEEITTGFDLEACGQTHTSPHVRAKLKLLMTMFKEEEVHMFREGRSMGPAAVNQFARGCRRLEEGKLDDFLTKSTVFGDFLAEVRRVEEQLPGAQSADGTGDDDEQMQPQRSSSPRSSSPTSDVPSEPSARCSPSPGSDDHSEPSTRSIQSNHSVASILSSVDPNEPEDDGDDRTECKLSSGRFGSFYTDPRTGLMAYTKEEGGDDEQEDEEEEDQEHHGARTYFDSDGEGSESD
ncbi:hypothetical protein C8R46DRAFT_1159212 [Mycena filopes]|nr:hypothetical protein C8R46DRAFT_1159212 [Mycena filopes]